MVPVPCIPIEDVEECDIPTARITAITEAISGKSLINFIRIPTES
jgi:hypothetical protein